MSMKEQMRTTALFAYPEHTLAWEYLAGFDYPWEALDGLSAFIRRLGESLSEEEYDRIGEDVWIAKSAKLAPTASIAGPTIIGPRAEVRQCAYVRGSALVGADCVVGNSVELKNCILFDGVQVPHFNYVGDSVLGYRSHMGAGAVTSNVKSDKTLVSVRGEEERLDTGRRKLGAILGDFVEVGCNSVLNPGTVIGRESTVYPLSSVRGFVAERCIYKAAGDVVRKRS